MAKQTQRKDMPVRLTHEAIQWARIASGYTGESMAEYASRVVAERGKADAEELHAKLTAEQADEPAEEPAPSPAPKRRGRPKKPVAGGDAAG